MEKVSNNVNTKGLNQNKITKVSYALESFYDKNQVKFI